ncbi:MAG: V-type ATPase 116kDa subunit family protein [Candidatus Paceibacterota bacterium]
MAVVALKKIQLLLHKNDRDVVLKELQKSGSLAFEEVQNKENLEKYSQTEFDYNRELSSINFALSFLDTHLPEKISFKRKLEGNFITTTDEECSDLEKNFSYHTIVNEIQDIEKTLNVCKTERASLLEKKELLTPWKNYSASAQASATSVYTFSFFVIGNDATKKYLSSLLTENGILHHYEEVSKYAHVLVVLKEKKEIVSEIIKSSGTEEVTLPSLPHSIQKELELIDSSLLELDKLEEKTKNKIQEYVIYRNKLKQLSDYLRWKKERYEVGHNAFHTNSVLVFEGWIKERQIPYLEEKISKHTRLFAIEEIPLSEGEIPPTEIENNWLIKPFETITRLYGLPGYNDLDPTLFLSAFFFIFFGLCLTDVGYGIFVMILTGSLLAFFRLPRDNRPFVLLLFLGGLASSLAGLLFGGYLGIDTALLPSWTQKIQTFNPVLNPLPVLFLSLALGVLQIMFGITLRIVREWKNNNLLDGIIGHGPWLFLFTAVILFTLKSFGIITAGSPQFYTYLLYVGVGLLIITQGRHEKNIFSKAFKGVMSLYDSINYFSDILSYSRILALGLATSALAFSVNLIASLIGEIIPFVGGAVAVVIIIVGHLFNLTVNILGAFIHSARLQFVEFFSKFIVDTGKEFRVFKRVPRFVNIE